MKYEKKDFRTVNELAETKLYVLCIYPIFTATKREKLWQIPAFSMLKLQKKPICIVVKCSVGKIY